LASLFLALAFTSNNEIKELELGADAPLVQNDFRNIDGKKIKLASLKKENGLVLVFSCNTCPFVVGSSSFGGWEKSYNEYAAFAAQKGFGFVLVNANEAKREAGDSFKDMQKRAEEKGYTMPYLLDDKSELANAFGAKTTPHVFVLDKDMKLAYKGSLDNSWDSKKEKHEAYLNEALNDLALGTAVRQASTAPRGCSIKRK